MARQGKGSSEQRTESAVCVAVSVERHSVLGEYDMAEWKLHGAAFTAAHMLLPLQHTLQLHAQLGLLPDQYVYVCQCPSAIYTSPRKKILETFVRLGHLEKVAS